MRKFRAKVDNFGFQNRYWIKGEIVTVGDDERITKKHPLASHFEEMESPKEVPKKDEDKKDKKDKK